MPPNQASACHHASASAGVDAGAQLDEQVAFGLGRLLDGIEAMMSASQASADTP